MTDWQEEMSGQSWEGHPQIGPASKISNLEPNLSDSLFLLMPCHHHLPSLLVSPPCLLPRLLSQMPTQRKHRHPPKLPHPPTPSHWGASFIPRSFTSKLQAKES